MTIPVWAILILVSWLAATISGVAGFGGSLVILPVFSFLIGAKQAIPILTIAWMMGNISRAGFGYKEIRWRPVLYFCAGAIPSAIIGSRVFVELPSGIIMKAIAIFLLVIVALRHFNIQIAIPEKWFVLCGAVVGFLSAVLGSAGPIGAVVFLSLNLAPSAYVASEAVTAVMMHFTKTVVYGKYALLSVQDILTGIVLGSAMAVGSWTARRFIKNISSKTFGRVVDALLVIAAIGLFLNK